MTAAAALVLGAASGLALAQQEPLHDQDLPEQLQREPLQEGDPSEGWVGPDEEQAEGEDEARLRPDPSPEQHDVIGEDPLPQERMLEEDELSDPRRGDHPATS